MLIFRERERERERELNLSSVMVLCKGVCSLFIPLKLRSAVHVEPTKLWEPWHILWDRMELGRSKVSTKVRGFAFGSISLHLISKRIKEILTQKHQYNAKYLSRFNDKDAFRKLKKNSILFPDFSCMYRRMCVHAHYIPGRRNTW